MNSPTLFDNLESGDRSRFPESLLTRFDRHEKEMVRFLGAEYGDLSQHEKLAVMLTSQFVRDGHVCMPVDRSISELLQILDFDEIEDVASQEFLNRKLKIGTGCLIGEPGTDKPMILAGNRLYIHKYFKQESNLKDWILEKSNWTTGFELLPKHKEVLNYLFGRDSDGTNWQKVAAGMSLFKSFLIVSGGPGTGKTTTVARMLALHQKISRQPLRIALAAPTGKAAGRMGEALFGELQSLNLPEEQLKQFPSEAKTIHRLLRDVEDMGLLPPVRKKMLNYDIVVVDEASMIDLTLINRLIQHISDDTKLVLLGDKDQLASVEAGSVFADLCRKKENDFQSTTVKKLRQLGCDLSADGGKVSGIDDSIVYLLKSYRFDEKSGIGQLAGNVKKGISNENMVADLFGGFDEVYKYEFTYNKADFSRLTSNLRERVQAVALIDQPVKALAFWKESVWLTVLRQGLSGSERLNRLTEQILATSRSVRMQQGWYHGRPVIITRNNYELGIYNGDHGVCMQDEQGDFSVYVQSGSAIKKIKPEQLLHFSPAFFLTVHKSQGSEFDEVNLLMPGNNTPILTKELLYTAITRAKSRFNLYGNLGQFVTASNRSTERYSGLRDLL